MKIALEVKVGLVLVYIMINFVLINSLLWCMNQPSNIYLTLGVLCGITTILINTFIVRKYLQKKLAEQECTNE
jgi:hypothetical protein